MSSRTVALSQKKAGRADGVMDTLSYVELQTAFQSVVNQHKVRPACRPLLMLLPLQMALSRFSPPLARCRTRLP